MNARRWTIMINRMNMIRTTLYSRNTTSTIHTALQSFQKHSIASKPNTINHQRKPTVQTITPLPDIIDDSIQPELPGTHCWKCHHYEPPSLVDNSQQLQIPSRLFCKNTQCAVLQPLQRPPPNHFALLMPEKYSQLNDELLHNAFQVDLADLKRRYRGLQQMLHPDNFTTKSNQERLLSEEQSTLVNKAYQTLRDPLTRAQYMLDMYGVGISESTSINEPQFLAQIMDIQESIESAENDVQVINQIKSDNQVEIQKAEKSIAACFRQSDLDGAKQATIKMQYLRTIDTLINEKQ
ncbi:molecular chaperone [Batrachochytrium dendrobatidis]|nr:molecular chaperone [Batrachochytrium dendrobatidis]